jgi:hypothetical protein
MQPFTVSKIGSFFKVVLTLSKQLVCQKFKRNISSTRIQIWLAVHRIHPQPRHPAFQPRTVIVAQNT